MGQRRVGVFLGVLVVAALAFVLPATAAPTASSGSFKTVKVKAAGISLQYPKTWTVVARTKKDLAAQIKQLAKKNPKLAQALKPEQAGFSATAKLQATDLGAVAAGRPASNLSVQVETQGGFPSSLDEFTSALQPKYGKVGGTFLGTSAVKISGRTSYRIDGVVPVTTPGGALIRIHEGTLFVARGEGAVIITVGTLDDAAGAKLIDRILGSVRRA